MEGRMMRRAPQTTVGVLTPPMGGADQATGLREDPI